MSQSSTRAVHHFTLTKVLILHAVATSALNALHAGGYVCRAVHASFGLAQDSELSHSGSQGLGFMPDPPKLQAEHLRFRASGFSGVAA